MKLKRLVKKCSVTLFLSMFTLISFAQNRQLSGVVKDQAGETMIGVNVIVNGTENGTITDADGRYELNDVPSNATIIFSYIGYEKVEINSGAKQIVNATLSEDTKKLDEVVVVGYGVVKKRDLTGAVSSVKADEIAKVASSNAMQAMQAKVPGLDITQSSGQAGSGLNMNLRGTRSISASNSPLIIVDGVEYGSTLDINSADIESMEVLKDASSTAIYGTRGANGVIIITTKRGKAGKTKVYANAYISSNSPTDVPKIMYGQKEIDFRIEKARYAAEKAAGVEAGSTAIVMPTVESVLNKTAMGGVQNHELSEYEIYQQNLYTDWLDIALQNGLTQNYEVGVSGGNEKTNFNLSFGIMKEEGLLKNDEMSRYNGKFNIDHQLYDNVKIGASLLYTYKNHDKRADNVFNQALKMTSIAVPYYSDGSIIKRPSPQVEAHASPLLDEVPGAYENNTLSNRFFGNAYLEWDIIKDLKFKTMFALDANDSRQGIYQDYESVALLQSSNGGKISLTNKNSNSWTWENTLNYMTDFDGSDHRLTAMVGHSVNESIAESYVRSGKTKNEHYYSSTWHDLGNITEFDSPTNAYVKQSMVSVFGRVNYSLLDRYLFTASLRGDGSSVLASDNKWGYFPSASAAWRIKDESFLADVDEISNLKIRASWGVSGNAAVNPYQTITSVTDEQLYYSFDGSTVAGQVPNSIGNKELTWETTTSYDLGLDFGFFDNRISGSIDYYWGKTTDLLYNRSLPATSVYPQILANIGETKTKGVEIALNTLVINNKDFKWDINWSATMFKDEISKLSDGVKMNISGKTGQIVGEAVSLYYDYDADGCWKIGEYETTKNAWEAAHPGETYGITAEQATPGQIKIVDRNDNGKIDEDDRKVYNRSPKAVLGMNNTVTYKDFTLSVLLYARIGQWIGYSYNTNYRPVDTANSTDVDYWTPENQNAKFPRPGLSESPYFSSLQYEKASYLKVKDITLSYNLPKSILSKAKIQNVKVYGSLKNYFTFSNIDNYDPERGGAISFPLAKQVVFGINLEF